MTTYPASIDNSLTIPIVIDNNTPVQGVVVNRLREAILAIETELGVKPSATYGTVRARLDALEGAIANLKIIELNKDLGGTLAEPLVIGIQGRPVSDVAPTNGQALAWNGIAWTPTTISGGGGGGNQNLFTTLSFGNVTDGYDIIVSAGDKITITDGPVNATDAVNKAYVDGYSGSTRNLNNVIYVDSGGTGDGNIEDPLGSVADALDVITKLVIIAPGDYSDESPIAIFSNRKYYISGMNFPGIDSSLQAALITTLPQLVMPGQFGEQGTMTLSNLNLVNGLSLAASIKINNCVNISIGPATNGDYCSTDIIDSHITALDVSSLNAVGCSFTFNAAINITGTVATIISSQLYGTTTVTFTTDPGVLYIDESSNYADVVVVNGTKIILGSNLSAVLSIGNSAGNQYITNLLNPINPQDAVTKSYVDGYVVQHLPYIFVDDFGAVGNGVTDDTVAIQAALTYAKSVSSIKVVLSPGKTYVVAGQLDCSGALGVVLGGFGGYGAPSLYMTGGNQGVGENNWLISFQSTLACGIENCGIYMRNFDFDGYAIALTHTISGGDTTSFNMNNVDIEGQIYDSVNLSMHICVFATPIINTSFNNVHFRRARIGIKGGLGPGIIRDCIFNDMQEVPIDITGQSWLIESCTFEPVTEGPNDKLAKAVLATGLQGFSFHNNWVGDDGLLSTGYWITMFGVNGGSIIGNNLGTIRPAVASILASGVNGCIISGNSFLSGKIVEFTGASSYDFSVKNNGFTGTAPIINGANCIKLDWTTGTGDPNFYIDNANLITAFIGSYYGIVCGYDNVLHNIPFGDSYSIAIGSSGVLPVWGATNGAAIIWEDPSHGFGTNLAYLPPQNTVNAGHNFFTKDPYNLTYGQSPKVKVNEFGLQIRDGYVTTAVAGYANIDSLPASSDGYQSFSRLAVLANDGYGTQEILTANKIYRFQRTTTNATPTNAFTIAVANNSRVTINWEIIGDIISDGYSYNRISQSTFERINGGAAAQLSTTTDSLPASCAHTGAPVWDANMAVSGNNIAITLTGATSKTIKWQIIMSYFYRDYL